MSNPRGFSGSFTSARALGLCFGLIWVGAVACSKNDPLTMLSPGPDGDPATTDPSTQTQPDPAQEKSQSVSTTSDVAPVGTDQQPSTAPDQGAAGAAGSSGSGTSSGSGGSGGDSGASHSSDTWTTAPALRDAVTLGDADLAQQALAILGNSSTGAPGSCNTGCHTMDRATLTQWAQYTQDFTTGCLGNTDLADQAAVDAMLACFQSRASKPGSSFDPKQFGVYAAAAGLPWFEFVFQHGSGLDATASTSFKKQVGMPKVGTPLTQQQFDLVSEWFARHLPNLFDLIPADSGESCTAGLEPDLGSYISTMATDGWRARNAQVPLLMFGCSPGQTGSQCLSSLPRAADESYGAGWESMPGAQIRMLHDNSAALTTYWTRSSADGRFIGSGLAAPADPIAAGQFIDLQNRVDALHGKTIAGDFAYDATFFPDNSGFLVQRGGYDDGSDNAPTDGQVSSQAVSIACPQSVLGGDPATVSGSESGCTELDAKFGLYQQPAKATDGSDYWVVHGSYQSDNGGFSPTLQDPSAAFGLNASITLTPMINDGSGFSAGTATTIVTPHQGDPVLSPSGGLLVLRVKGPDALTTIDGQGVVQAPQSGYALYRVNRTGSGNSATATLQDLGRICLTGSKATISYDERWMVFHHYVTAADATALGFTGADDPNFAQYLSDGSSNLYLADLTTGNVQRITLMGSGQYALFPHFRSDGWIYFVVRTVTGQEYFAASDAALVSEAQSH